MSSTARDRGERMLARGLSTTTLCVLLIALSGVAPEGETSSSCRSECLREPFPSLYGNEDVISAAIARAERIAAPARKATGLTVPHHLVAADLIARTFQSLDGRTVERVVILFPDHF